MFVGTRQLKYFILQFTVRNKRNGTNDTIRGTRYTFIHFKLKKKKKTYFYYCSRLQQPVIFLIIIISITLNEMVFNSISEELTYCKQKKRLRGKICCV